MLQRNQITGMRVVAPEIPEPVITLNDSAFTFYLTGSRFWNKAGLMSDWDFYTLDSTEVRAFLRENGFEEEYTNAYDDNNANAVYLNGRVHVQLVSDVDIKTRAQTLIMHYFRDEFYNMSKIQRKAVWQITQKLVLDAS